MPDMLQNIRKGWKKKAELGCIPIFMYNALGLRETGDFKWLL